MIVSDITEYLEEIAPIKLQESYDNSGLLIGSPDKTVSKVLVSLDITEDVLDEAINYKCDLIISHHPVIFNGIKKLTGQTAVERIVKGAIQNDIALYAMHTNLDNINTGVNNILCEKLGLTNLKILSPKKDLLCKLVTFCPVDDAEQVRNALFKAGAGHIGNYDNCSFNSEGTGSFRGSVHTDPYVGEKGKLHFEKELRIETIYPKYLEKRILKTLLKEHPYEEVAYDIYYLGNIFITVGAGMTGELFKGMSEMDFLAHVKNVTGSKCLRHSELTGHEIKRVAVCGGSGSFLIQDALREKVDMFITGDIKYHDFFLAEKKLVIVDVGHYESEQFVKELIYSKLIKKFSNFAVLISEANINSVNYL